MANLQKVIKLTQAQYDTLAAGGTVGQYTGLNDNYIYLVKDTNVYATEDYVDTAIEDLATVAKTGSYNDLSNKPTITDTKNTAGSTNDNSKLFLVGAKTQAANPQTYSRSNTFINQYGVLINTTGFSSYDYASTSAGLLNIGVNLLQYTSGSGPASLSMTSSTHGGFKLGETSGTSIGDPHNIYLQKTAGSAYTGTAYLLFPNVGTSSSPKTLATTDDIPDDSNLVHTTGTETIGGEKTFSLGGYSVAFHAFNNNDQHLYIVLDNGGGNGSCIRYDDFELNNYHLYFPKNNGTLVLDSEVSKNQAHSIVVYDALHNISGKNLSAYTAVETTLGNYPVIIIKTSSSATLTEEQARSYMAAQTGSTFLPVYDYDRPTYSYFIFANGKLYKPQYDTTNGLVLYYLNQIAFASSAAKVISAEFVQAGYNVTIVITNSSHTSEWTSTIVYDDNPNTHEIGRFSSANGTLTVNTETGLIDITFDGGLVSVPSPTVTSGITVDYGDSGHYRFNIANSGTITFDGID